MTKILPKVDCEVVHIVLKKHFWRKKWDVMKKGKVNWKE